MSRLYIGLDTSNYTTSAALFDAEKGIFLSNVKRLLGVSEGERGLRQSDAVFAHVKNLPSVTSEAFDGAIPEKIRAIGVSSTPRDVEGSYMPCFQVGFAAASTLSNAMKKPLHTFSHQAGHVMAAVFSSGAMELCEKDFLAFHVSGGTTELLLVKRGTARPFDIEKIGGTLDLNAGQAIDRAGVRLGLKFPCGAELEKLALSNDTPIERAGVSVKGCECNLSGLENHVDKLISEGWTKEYVAAYVLDFVGRTLVKLTANTLEKLGDIPVLYAGGVMSNSIIKDMLRAKLRKRELHFAEPKFSSDNAAGTALLTAMAEGEKIGR